MRVRSLQRVRARLSRLAVIILIALLLAPYQVIAATPTISARGWGSVVRQSDPEEEAVTFDTLLPAKTYGLYGEVRNVGQQITSGGFRSVFETLLPLIGELPKELTRTMLFASAHANEISRSRMMFATLPARRDVPSILLVIELSSSEAAREFEPDFRAFITSLLMTGDVPSQQSRSAPFFIKSMGRLVVLTDSSFTLKQLKPEGQRLLSADPSFRDARAHFSSEDLFVYYDSKQYEETSKRTYEDFLKSQAEARDELPETLEARTEAQTSAETTIATNKVVEEEAPAPPVPEEEKAEKKEEPVKIEEATARPVPPVSATATPGPQKSEDERTSDEAQSLPPPSPSVEGVPGGMKTFDMLMGMLFSNLSSSQASSYDSIAFALSFEVDTFAVRALFLSSPGGQVAAVPFLPFLISGPPLALVASNYLPSDTDIFVSGSLDLPRIYNELYPALSKASLSTDSRDGQPVARRRRGQSEASSTFLTRTAAFEKKHKVKIKDELLPALGNEVAVGLPAHLFSGPSAHAAGAAAPEPPQVGPLIVISIQNKKLLQPHIPALLELFDVMKAGEKGKTEKRGEIEIIRYPSASYALVDQVLIAGQDVRDVRRALDARVSGQTLGASKEFRDYMRWQPRNLLNQVHVSSSIMKGILDDAKKSFGKADDRTKEFFAQLNFPPEPISYAASMEVLGAQHEVRLPKNLIITLVGYMLASDNQAIIPRNEMTAKSILSQLKESQETYSLKHGRYATSEELEAEELFSKLSIEQAGYQFELNVSGRSYQATATPKQYGKTGKLSFYTDETGILRAGDHGGSPATAQDNPIGN